MDPVENISYGVRMRVNRLGTRIIRFADDRKAIFDSVDLSDDQKTEKIEAARRLLRQDLDTAFDSGDGSITSEIDHILEESKEQPAEIRKGALKAAGIWRQELPGLRQFLEYCAGMIEAHPGEVSPEVRESQKCITEASVVLDKIAGRVARELR